MDPLSDVLSLLEPRNYLSAGLDAGGEWSIQFPDQQRGIKCGAIVSGHCWLAVDGVAEPVHLEPGDCFLLPRGWPFRVASDLGLEPTDAGAIFSPARTGSIRSFNGGGDCLLVSSRFALSGDHAGILLRMLPPIVHIRAQPDDSPLRWPVERMMRELRERQPGSFLVVQHLAHMILIEALRLHMADKFGSGVGWLFALTDKHIGTAIGAMHEDPAHGWTLQTLAARAGMSRSNFAQRFKQMVGTSAMDYLTRWRMMLAGDRLTNSSDPVAVIALSLGYESESAFSTAFKRVMGRSPRQYGRGRRAAAPAHGSGEPANANRRDLTHDPENRNRFSDRIMR